MTSESAESPNSATGVALERKRRMAPWATVVLPLVGLGFSVTLDGSDLRYPAWFHAFPWLNTIYNVLMFITSMLAWPGCAVLGLIVGLGLLHMRPSTRGLTAIGVTAITLSLLVLGLWITLLAESVPAIHSLLAKR